MKFQNTHKYILEDFKILKSPNSHSELLTNAIEIQNGGYLLPISSFDIDNIELIKKLKTWRNNHNYAYYNSPLATDKSTKIWLKKLIYETPNKILFKIYV